MYAVFHLTGELLFLSPPYFAPLKETISKKIQNEGFVKRVFFKYIQYSPLCSKRKNVVLRYLALSLTVNIGQVSLYFLA